MKPLAFPLTPHVSYLLEECSSKAAIPHLHGMFQALLFLCALSSECYNASPSKLFSLFTFIFLVVLFCSGFPDVNQCVDHHTWGRIIPPPCSVHILALY